MKKNVLLISTHKETVNLFNFFKELNSNNCSLSLLSSDRVLIKKFKEENLLSRKILNCFNTKSSFLFLIFYIIILIPKSFFLLFRLWIQKKKYNNIILFDWSEKVFYTPIAKILKINVIWITIPENNLNTQNKLIIKLSKLYSKNINNIALSSFTKNQLVKLNFPKDKIQVVNLGIKLKNYQDQVDIFEKIAENKHNINHKFFTVGTITTLNKAHNLEMLFHAIKKCLIVIPKLQLIVVGNGTEQNKLKWIIKKLEIDNMVWFVGGKDNYRKWFDSFDIFVNTSEHLKIKNIQTILRAMHNKLPIIGSINIGLEDILDSENGVLSNFNDSEEIAKNIINLYRHRDVREKLAKNAQATVDKNFKLDRMVNEIKNFLN